MVNTRAGDEAVSESRRFSHTDCSVRQGGCIFIKFYTIAVVPEVRFVMPYQTVFSVVPIRIQIHL